MYFFAHTHTHMQGTTEPSVSTEPSISTDSGGGGGGLSAGIIIGGAAGGAIALFVIAAIVICAVCCCCKKSRTGDYTPGGGPIMVARYWDNRTDHTQNRGRSGSTLSRGSRGSLRSSIRSSMSSIGSMIRFGRGSKRGSGRRGDKTASEQTLMTVTPL